jgi:hypothetical protein
MRTRALLVSLLPTGALGLASASARAAIIVVDPDDFSDGTDISAAFAGAVGARRQADSR